MLDVLCMMFKDFIQKIQRKLMKTRLQPIRVFCFHQVSDEFDSSTMWECDWMQTEQFKRNIMQLKEEYTFISLSEAYKKMQHDVFRCKKYAVLTADDGWASLLNIIPWLVEQDVPITLFLNPAYLDGKHFQARDTEKLLTNEDIVALFNQYPNIVTVASHGYTHVDASSLLLNEFKSNVLNAEIIIKYFKNKVNFYAFTYGRYNAEQIAYLKEENIVPVLADKLMNYKFDGAIHRECIDGKEL